MDNSILKRVLGLLLIITAVMLTACGAGNHEFAGSVLESTQQLPDFTLQGVDGPVSLSDFEGQYVFVYFGYTYCPDICPDSLSKISRAIRALDPDDAEQFTAILVSVDPERDTPELLAQYVSHFNPRFVGVTGTKEEIDLAGEPYYLYYEKHEGTVASGYLIDHSSRMFLVDKNGFGRVAYPFDAKAEDIAEDLKWLLRHDS
jgi:protein SCO1/2